MKRARAVGRASLGARLRVLRVARGLSQGDLARLVGRHQTVIGPYERDEYAPSREIVERLAAALATSPEYLLFGREPRRSAVDVIGRVGAAGVVAIDEAHLPVSLVAARLVALRVEDETMAPTFRAGQWVLTERATVEPTTCLGRDGIVELHDGRQLLRRLLPAATAGRFDLAAYNAPLLSAVAVQAVRPVLGVLWNDALLADQEETAS